MPTQAYLDEIKSFQEKYNFDFENYTQATDKILEEISELKRAIQSGNADEIQKECGDFLIWKVARLLQMC